MIHFYPLHLPMCQLGVRNVGLKNTPMKAYSVNLLSKNSSSPSISEAVDQKNSSDIFRQ